MFVETPNLVPFNAMRAPDALTVSIDVGYPDEVARVPLVPPASMQYATSCTAPDVATAAVRAFAQPHSPRGMLASA